MTDFNLYFLIYLLWLILSINVPSFGQNLYEVLGVNENSSQKDIKKSFRKLALEKHPDKLGPFSDEYEESTANLNFIKILHAYEILSDSEKRRTYDLEGIQENSKDTPKTHVFNNDIQYDEKPFDLFAKFTGGAFSFHFKGKGVRPVANTFVTFPLTLEQMMKGHFQNYTVPRQEICSTCGGTGSSNPKNMPKCSLCQGTGHAMHLYEEGATTSINGFKQSVLMTCKACHGLGKVSDKGCSECGGIRTVIKKRAFELKTPPGTLPGYQLHFPGAGNQFPGREPGSLFFTASFQPHSKFQLEANGDLIYKAKISLMDALTGFKRFILLATGEKLEFIHNFITFGGYRKTFKGFGMPKLDGTEAADLHVDVSVQFPPRLTKDMIKNLKTVLSNDEFHILNAILRLLSLQQPVPIDTEEYKYCDKCFLDYAEDPLNCTPVILYWTWASCTM